MTYKSHLPKDEYIQWLSAKAHLVLAFCRVAHENGDECQPYAHSHVLVDFGKIFQTRDEHFFCWDWKPHQNGWANCGITTKYPEVDSCGRIHCNIKFLPSRRAFEDAKIYIAKEDPANADLAQQGFSRVVRVECTCSAAHDPVVLRRKREYRENVAVEVFRGPLPGSKRIRLVPNGGDREHEGDSESDDESSSDGMEDEGSDNRPNSFIRAWTEVVRHIGEHKEWEDFLNKVQRGEIEVSATVGGRVKQLVAQHFDDIARQMGYLGDNNGEDSSEEEQQPPGSQERELSTR